MSEEQQRKIKEIFFAACEKPEAERGEFLREACGDDQSLRREVELLLAHHSEATIIPARRNRAIDLLFDDAPASSPSGSRSGSKLSNVSKRIHRWAAKLGLSGQIALGASFAIIVLVGLLIWLRSHIATVIERSTYSELATLMEAADQSVIHWLDGRRREVVCLADDPQVRAALGALPPPPATNNAATNNAAANAPPEPEAGVAAGAALIAAVRKSAGDDSEIIVWNRNKQVLATNAPAETPKPEPIEKLNDVFPAVFAGESTVLLPHQAQQLAGPGWFGHGKPRIGVVAPLRNSADEIVAALYVSRPSFVDDLNRMLEKFRLQQTGETYLFNRTGFLLSESRFRDQLIRLGVLAENENSVLGFKASDPGGDLTQGYEPERPYEVNYPPQALMQAVNSKGPGGVIQGPYRDYRGVTVLGASRFHIDPLYQEGGYGICVEIDRDEALAALDYTAVMVAIAVVMLFCTLGAIFWSSWANRRLRRRLAEQPLIGSYLLDIQIGEGGMGRVYRAQHALLKRPTAVKIIKPDLVSDQTMAWFEREVKLAARLSHPNTIEIYDYGRTENGQFYCAMEYLRGLTLSQVMLIDGYLPLARALHVLYQACSSLAEAHDQGLIHRDVKLHNMMLCLIGGEADFVKVLDFGLAKQSEESNPHETTRSSRSLVGTPLYMAPERLKAPYLTDARGDVYSIGVAAFKLLTGRDLFTADSDIELFNQTLHTPAPLTSSAAKQQIPAELDRIIAECLAKDPNDRPYSARVLAEALEPLVAMYPWKQSSATAWWRSNRDRIRDLSPHWDDKVLTALAPVAVRRVPGIAP